MLGTLVCATRPGPASTESVVAVTAHQREVAVVVADTVVVAVRCTFDRDGLAAPDGRPHRVPTISSSLSDQRLRRALLELRLGRLAFGRRVRAGDLARLDALLEAPQLVFDLRLGEG